MTDEAVIKRLQDVDRFIVIHEGDGRHATICESYKEAAEAVIQGMWFGDTAEIIKEDELASQLYSAVLNPESDQWQDMDGKEIRYDFEDGSVTVIRIPVAFPAIKAERDAQAATIRALQEKNEGLREALRKIMDPQPFSAHLDPRCCQHTFDDACELFSDIARAALKDSPND